MAIKNGSSNNIDGNRFWQRQCDLNLKTNDCYFKHGFFAVATKTNGRALRTG